MKFKTKKLIAICTVLVGFITVVQAQTRPISTAVPFLRISPDARSSAMGNTGLATSADANSIFWNLAKVPFAKSNAGISATYTPWFRNIGAKDQFLATLSGYHKLGDMDAFSASVRYFGGGTINYTDLNGNQLYQGKPKEFAVDAGYSRKLSSKSAIGLAVRFIKSDIAGSELVDDNTFKKAAAFSADINYYYNGLSAEGSGWCFGANMSNLGQKMNYVKHSSNGDFLPANLGIGTSYTKQMDAENKLTFALDLNKLLVPTLIDTSASGKLSYQNKSVVSSWASSLGDGEDVKEITVSLGAEYTYNDQFSLRAGYYMENKDKGNRSCVTAGAGFMYKDIGLNLSYIVPAGSGTTRNALGNTLRFSIAFNFAGAK